MSEEALVLEKEEAIEGFEGFAKVWFVSGTLMIKKNHSRMVWFVSGTWPRTNTNMINFH